MSNTVSQRINEVMKRENLNYSSLGDKLGYSDVVVRNIITERNKPSYDFILSMVQTFVWLDTNWLITGNGEMLIENNEKNLIRPPTIEKCSNCEILEAKLRDKEETITFLKSSLADKDEIITMLKAKASTQDNKTEHREAS